MRNEVDHFWSQDNRKLKLLGHFCGNLYVEAFIAGSIDAETCVGFLRSQATGLGYPLLKKLALIAREDKSNTTNYNLCIDRNSMMKQVFSAEIDKRPSSIQNTSHTKSSPVYLKLIDRRTECLALDWLDASKRTAKEIGAARKVCFLQNLIVAILIPAYTETFVLDTGNELEQQVLDDAYFNAENKDKVDEMCVVAILSTLHNLFVRKSLPHHLYNAPFRLPPFGQHPIINIENSSFFNEDTTPILASISIPSSMVIKHHTRKNSRWRCPNNLMTAAERSIFLRGVLTVSGDYGWFSVIVGSTIMPSVLFYGDRKHLINTVKSNNFSAITCSYWNKYMDCRSYGFEIIDTPENNCGFRIRAAIDCSNTDFHSPVTRVNKKKTSIINAVKNPFFIRHTEPKWYNKNAMCGEVLENVGVTLEQHVRVSDEYMDRFGSLLLGREKKWTCNYLDRIKSLETISNNLKGKIDTMCKILETKYNYKSSSLYYKQITATSDDPIKMKIIASINKRRYLCNILEFAIISSEKKDEVEEDHTKTGNGGCAFSKYKKKQLEPKQHLIVKVNKYIEAFSLIKMLRNDCERNKCRFKEAEIRECANELVRELYRASARSYVHDLVLKRTNVHLTWQRPYDENANTIMSLIPKCKLHTVLYDKDSRDVKLLNFLRTRDGNYNPIRHSMLELVYGEEYAKDVSTVTCFEWLKWCSKKGVIKYEDFLDRYEKTGEEDKDEREFFRLKKCSRDHTKDIKKIENVLNSDTLYSYSLDKNVQTHASSSTVVKNDTDGKTSMVGWDYIFSIGKGEKTTKKRKLETIDISSSDDDDEEEEEEEEEEDEGKRMKMNNCSSSIKNKSKNKNGRMCCTDILNVVEPSLPNTLSFNCVKSMDVLNLL
nr:wsv226 [Shrimp white spot syndrome virus]